MKCYFLQRSFQNLVKSKDTNISTVERLQDYYAEFALESIRNKKGVEFILSYASHKQTGLFIVLILTCATSLKTKWVLDEI